MAEEKAVAQEANTINQEAAAKEEDNKIPEFNETEESKPPAKSTPVPTLYVRNLTDKIKIQGK